MVELVKLNVKDLLVIAKDLGVVGRHKMNKEVLIRNIEGLRETKLVELNGKQFEVVKQDENGNVLKTAKEVKEVASCENSFETDLLSGLNFIKESWKTQVEAPLLEELYFVEEVWDTKIRTPLSDEPNKIKIKNDYIENIKIGTIVAFQINSSKILSGMVDEIHKFDFIVKTKNGIRFTVRKKNIIWVKTGSRWPKGIYLALKGGEPLSERKGCS